MAKRKTLPKDFEEMVKSGKEEEIKALFSACDINAYGGYCKGNAFFFPISYDLMKWFLAQGADINYINAYGDTPLLYHAGHRFAVESAMNLIKLGADVHYMTKLYQTNALHNAIPTGSVELDNGGINWDRDFLHMSKALLQYLHMGNTLCQKEYDELDQIFKAMRDDSEEELNREAELAVKWVTLNLTPISLEHVDYRR